MNAHQLLNYNVIVVERQPKQQLPEDLALPEDFRREINAWMVNFFGYTEGIPDGQIKVSGKNAYMSAATQKQMYAELKNYYSGFRFAELW